ASAAPRGAGGAARTPALSSGAAVLVDGLERDNAILRQQLERHFATERALRAEADELAERLQWSRQRREAEMAAVEAEGARLRSAIQQQEESTGGVAAKIEELLGLISAEDAARAACEAAVVDAEEQVGRVTKELEGLQRLVLPKRVREWSLQTIVRMSTRSRCRARCCTPATRRSSCASPARPSWRPCARCSSS
ncbi:unnamed protein product, partial [Prorocentrum cordatum]